MVTPSTSGVVRTLSFLVVLVLCLLVGGIAITGPGVFHDPNETHYPGEIWTVGFPNNTNISCVTAIFLDMGDGVTRWYWYPGVTNDTGAINCSMNGDNRMSFNISKIGTTKYFYSGINMSYDDSVPGLYYYNYQYNFTNGTTWISPVHLFARPYVLAPVRVRIFYTEKTLSWSNYSFSYTPTRTDKPLIMEGSAIGLVNSQNSSEYYCAVYDEGKADFIKTKPGVVFNVVFIPNYNCAVPPVDVAGSVTYNLGQFKGGESTEVHFVYQTNFGENTPSSATPNHTLNTNVIMKWFTLIAQVAFYLAGIVVVGITALVAQHNWPAPVIVAFVYFFIIGGMLKGVGLL